MRDRDRRRAEAAHLFEDQIIDGICRDRIKPGGRLIEENQVRL